ncbi:MAG: HAD family hydrolase [bacterium]
MDYKAVIFDLDGTLLDTLDDLTDAVNATLAHFSYPAVTREKVRLAVGNGAGVLLQRVLPENATDFDAVLPWYKAYYAAHSLRKTAPYPGIPELLEKLSADGIPMAVVSNKQDDAVKSLCARFFGGRIAAAIGERPDVRRKPAPDSLLAAMDALGSSPANTIYVGDSEVDLLSAKNASLACASVAWGFREEAFLRAQGANLLFPTPEALYDRLFRRR